MGSDNPVGSEWGKWDLHVHTPCSIFHDYPGTIDEAWASFLTDLEKLPPEFKVIGINDYIFIEGYERVLAEKKKGRLANIDLILPVIELRLDKFAGVVKKDQDGAYSKSDWNRINLHVIFDQLEPEVIRQQFLSSLVQCYQLIPESIDNKWQAVITPASLTQLGKMIIDSVPDDQKAAYSSPLQEGFNNLCVSLDKVIEALTKHDLKDRFLLAVGKSEWENMKWTDQSIAEKKNVINRVDLVFTASQNPETYIKARAKLSEAKVLDKLLDCSDAHSLSHADVKDRIGNCFTWVKANATFAGLVQAVTEFDQRIFVGDTPPKQLLISGNRTKYASAISIKKRADAGSLDTWFDVNIPLNRDLVAIIGNKGSGKSALADVIALIGDTKNSASFSFLNDERFRDPRGKLASQYLGTLHWSDSTTSEKSLNENPLSSAVERIKYLPQSYLEDLCNELAGSGSSTFDGELRKIIYTHVPQEQQIGFNSLDGLLDFKISELEVERKQQVAELTKVNTEIANVEFRMSPEFRQALTQRLDARKRELVALEGAMPTEVDDPLESDVAREETALANAQLLELEENLIRIRTQEEQAHQKKGDANRGIAHVTRILQSVKNHARNHEQFLTELNLMLDEANTPIRAADVFDLRVDTTKLEELNTALISISRLLDPLTSLNGEASLALKARHIENSIAIIKGQMSEKQRLFLLYKEQLTQWKKAKADLVGEKNKPNSIYNLAFELEELSNLPSKREQLIELRLEILRSLHAVYPDQIHYQSTM